MKGGLFVVKKIILTTFCIMYIIVPFGVKADREDDIVTPRHIELIDV
jgi:hypothetical protein